MIDQLSTNSGVSKCHSHVENSRRNSVLAPKELQDIPVETSKHGEVLLGLKVADSGEQADASSHQAC